MLVKVIRNALGYTIAGIDLLTRPRKLKRTPEAQQKVDLATQKLALYQFFGCPFCIKTRRVIHRLNLNIEYRDASAGTPCREELETLGGKVQVPCLRIENDNGEVSWMYESGAIIEYLEQQFV